MCHLKQNKSQMRQLSELTKITYIIMTMFIFLLQLMSIATVNSQSITDPVLFWPQPSLLFVQIRFDRP